MRSVRTRSDSQGRRSRAIGCVAVLSSLLLVWGCAGGTDEEPVWIPPGAPRAILLLVVGDTAMGDETSANLIESLREDPDTVVFERYYVPSPDTRASIATLFTGYPEIGADGGVLLADDEDRSTLVTERPTMAELFSRMGYGTFAVVAGDGLDPKDGFGRGFGRYVHGAGYVGAAGVGEALGALENAPDFFLAFVYLTQLEEPEMVTELVESLRGLERFEEMLLVVTADHGPFDPDAATPGAELDEDVIHAPLLVKFPAGGTPETMFTKVTALTSGIDILPSLLALAGRDISGVLPGTPVFEGASAGHAIIDSPQAWAFLQDDFKLVVRGEQAFVYDLGQDPRATVDLASDLPDRTHSLLTRALELREARTRAVSAGAADEEGLDEETLEHLRSLGYIQ